MAPVITGFCEEDENPLGPFHEYVAPPTVLAVSDKLSPSQIGLLLDAVGAAGVTLIVTETVPSGPVQLPIVTFTE